MNSFVYTNGVIKSLETKILSKYKIHPLKNLSINDLVRSLYDAGIGTDTSSIEALLASESERVNKLIIDNSPNIDLTDLFFLKIDSRNIKALFKQKYFSKSLNKSSFSNGSVKFDLLIDTIINNKESSNVHLNKLISIINTYQLNKLSAFELSNLIDKVILEYSITYTKRKNQIMYTYFKNVIDVTNILSLARLCKLKSSNNIVNCYIEGSTISSDSFIKVYEQGIESLLSMYKHTLKDKIISYLNEYIKNNDLSLLEFKLNQFIIDETLLFKNDPFGIGPILCYYVEKNAEISNIRLVSTACDHSLESLELSDLYSY